MALVLIFALLTGAGGSAIREAALSHNLLVGYLNTNKQLTLVATVKSDPTQSAQKVIGSRRLPQSYSVLVSSKIITLNSQRYRIRLPLRISSHKRLSLIPGEEIEVTGKVIATKERKVAALFSVQGEVKRLHSASLIQRIASNTRNKFRVQASRVGDQSGALIPGLVLGDTSLESADFVVKMRRVGLTHLTAVSGANFAIVAAFILWLSQWFFRRQRARIVLTSLVLIGFIFLVRPSPSVLRATVMSAVLLIAKVRGISSNPISSLGMAIGVLVLVDPFQATDPGFALSVCATAGILLLAPSIETFFSERFGHEKLAELLAIPISATIMCTPIIIAISGTFSLVSIPANLLAAPVVAPITVVGFVAALIAPVFPQVTHFALLLINPFSKVIVIIAQQASSLPVIQLPKSYLGAGLILFILFAFRFFRKVLVIAAFILSSLGLVIVNSQWPGRDWEVVNCNVGQGDALVINLGQDQAIVIDAGPDPKLVDKCLRSLKIRQIPLLVLTHFHADHVAGLSGVLNRRKVGNVWLSNYQQPKNEKELVLGELGNISHQEVHQGQQVAFTSARGLVLIKVLWPNTWIDNFAPMPGDGSSINNSSIALLITVGRLRIFAPGDLEPPAQEALLSANEISNVDILKVAHHGSAYQFLPLLDRLKPKLALISVGVGNSYGHPAPSTIAALSQRGIKIRRTDLDGAIAVDKALRIRTKKSDWWNISWG